MNKTTFDPAKWLPYLAAIAQIVQFMNAGFTLFSWRGLAAGTFLGALVSVSVAYGASQYSTSWPREKRLLSIASLIMLMTFSPIVVGSAAYIDLPAGEFGKWAIVLSAAWGILPDYSVALCGFTAGRSWSKGEKPGATVTATPPATGATKPRKGGKVARNPVTDDELRTHLATHPGETYTATAQHFKVSRSAITKRIEKLYQVTK